MDLTYTKDNGVYGNELISQKLKNGEVFALSRMGLGEVRWVDWYLRGGLDFNCDGSLFSLNVYTPTLRHRLDFGGVYGNCGELFFKEYMGGISCADYQIFWFNYDGSDLVFHEQKNIFQTLSRDSLKLDFRVLAPYDHENFWSKSLEGKKVLVVYPFVDSIKFQYERKDLIWLNEHAGKLPNFDLITYKPFWSLGNVKPHGSWYETLNVMKDEISKLDFDVALLGCSHYGLPLVAHIKNNLRKSAIYMGGELQNLFGIHGSRWDSKETAIKCFNSNWIKSFDEKPNGFQLMDGGCYW